MNDTDTRKRAARTAVDGFIAVERIYRHAYQTLIVLKDRIKDDLNLKVESPLRNNAITTSDPSSWIFKFRGLFLSSSKIALEEYKKRQVPALFLQVSLHNPNGREPLIRYGVIEKIFNMTAWKGVRFDDYFRMILTELHAEPSAEVMKASHCEAIVHFDEKPLLDIREDSDVADLGREISEKYGPTILS
jgi:hypothetical protein